VIWLTLALATGIQAADPPAIEARDRHFPAYAFDDDSCEAWTAARSSGGAADKRAAWVLGFLSDYYRFSMQSDGAVANAAGIEGVKAWIGRANPLGSLTRARLALVRELEPRRARR
jgi:hypothetical protein